MLIIVISLHDQYHQHICTYFPIDSQQHHSDDDLHDVQVVWVGEQRLLTSGFSGKFVMSNEHDHVISDDDHDSSPI